MAVKVAVRIYDAEDKLVAGDDAPEQTTTATVAAGAQAVVTPAALLIKSPHLWSIQTPYLYTVVTEILDASSSSSSSSSGGGGGGGGEAVLDSVNTTLGVRSIKWDYDHGFFLNGENVKLRGFCHHDSFTGVGMAMPDRVWLLRAQQSRGVGLSF
jgi:beta-galactosidase